MFDDGNFARPRLGRPNTHCGAFFGIVGTRSPGLCGPWPFILCYLLALRRGPPFRLSHSCRFVATCSWLKWRWKYPYYHWSLGWIKAGHLSYGMPVDVAVGDRIRSATYLQRGRGGIHEVCINRSAEVVAVVETDIRPSFSRPGWLGLPVA